MQTKKRKTEQAVALQYDSPQELPRVTAVGHDWIAEKIIEIAKENNVPVYQDETLSEMLSKITVGQSVPEESAALIAEVISFLYHADQNIN